MLLVRESNVCGSTFRRHTTQLAHLCHSWYRKRIVDGRSLCEYVLGATSHWSNKHHLHQFPLTYFFCLFLVLRTSSATADSSSCGRMSQPPYNLSSVRQDSHSRTFASCECAFYSQKGNIKYWASAWFIDGRRWVVVGVHMSAVWFIVMCLEKCVDNSNPFIHPFTTDIRATCDFNCLNNEQRCTL